MTTWNIYKLDGRYMGQAQARNAETAFCQYMSIYFGDISGHEIEAKEDEPGTCEITYNGERFVVKATAKFAVKL